MFRHRFKQVCKKLKSLLPKTHRTNAIASKHGADGSRDKERGQKYREVNAHRVDQKYREVNAHRADKKYREVNAHRVDHSSCAVAVC